MLHVEGTMPTGELANDATARAPWAVFDDERQDWLVTGLRWRWLAWLWLLRHRK